MIPLVLLGGSRWLLGHGHGMLAQHRWCLRMHPDLPLQLPLLARHCHGLRSPVDFARQEHARRHDEEFPGKYAGIGAGASQNFSSPFEILSDTSQAGGLYCRINGLKHLP
jgi:hypothetical protein